MFTPMYSIMTLSVYWDNTLLRLGFSIFYSTNICWENYDHVILFSSFLCLYTEKITLRYIPLLVNTSFSSCYTFRQELQQDNLVALCLWNDLENFIQMYDIELTHFLVKANTINNVIPNNNSCLHCLYTQHIGETINRA